MGGQLDPAKPSWGAAGFSLIELLVVIAILSILSIGAVFSVGRTGDNSDLTRFRDTFDVQRALAIEGQELRGLRLGPKGMQPMIRRPDSVTPWQPLGQPVAWTGDGVAILTERPVPSGTPEIVFLPGGKGTAFSAVFEGGQRCVSDGWAGLTC